MDKDRFAQSSETSDGSPFESSTKGGVIGRYADRLKFTRWKNDTRDFPAHDLANAAFHRFNFG